MVVRNRQGTNLFIKELGKMVPGDGKLYVLPYEIAVKYKHVLEPIQMSDTPEPLPNKNPKPPRPLKLDDVDVIDIDADDTITETKKTKPLEGRSIKKGKCTAKNRNKIPNRKPGRPRKINK